MPQRAQRSALSRLWGQPRVRATVWQVGTGLAVLAALLWFQGNLAANLARRSLDLGFDFLWGPASFELGDNPVGYAAGDSFLLAFAAGLGNTLQVAAIGIALTACTGVAVALLRLSHNPLTAGAAKLYVEIARNTPLLLQLMFWHQLIVRVLPGPRLAWNPLPGVFLSNRGLIVPVLGWQPAFGWALAALALGIVLAVMARRRIAWLLPVLLPLGALAFAQPMAFDVPVLRGFNFAGGTTLSPEMVALVWALVFYQGAFAAETIRGGILGVPKGLTEAAASLGLSRAKATRLVVMPLALRIAIPPLTSQFMSLTKNSSLAVAIGYPDLVRVSNVAISETGRAVECIVITLAVYLVLSLATALAMNGWNARLLQRGT